jgi:hypothetical protein
VVAALRQRRIKSRFVNRKSRPAKPGGFCFAGSRIPHERPAPARAFSIFCESMGFPLSRE